MTGFGVDLKELQRMMDRDRRAKMIADSVTAEVMEVAREPRPDDWRKDVHDIVKLTAAMAVRRVYEEDAELKFLRRERDHLRNMILETAKSLPSPLRMVTESQETAAAWPA